MAERSTEPEPASSILAELSGLADGTLGEDRVSAVRALIASSPELEQRFEHEQRAVAALHELRADRAPLGLRIAVETRRPSVRRRRARFLYGGALAAASAAVALVILLAPGGSPGAPSVSQAAALSLRGPTLPAPAEDPTHATKLGVEVQDLYFPNWAGWARWRAVGRRVDRFAGRLAMTVYYDRGTNRIAYTILASPPLRWPPAQLRHLNGTDYEALTSNGRMIVTWRRAGHTCLLSGTGMAARELARLAAWEPSGLEG